MEQEDRELLSRALDVLEAQNEHADRVEEENDRPARVALAKAEPDHGPIAERIARAEAVIAYAESAARARVAAVERWATSSPLARAA